MKNLFAVVFTLVERAFCMVSERVHNALSASYEVVSHLVYDLTCGLPSQRTSFLLCKAVR